MNNQQYERYEANLLAKQIAYVEHAPLSDRKAAAAEWLDDCANSPETVAERIRWIINGTYGKGAYDRAKLIKSQSARANKVAQFSILVAALEWHCPARMAAEAWKKLTKRQQYTLNRLIAKEIAYKSEE